VKLSVKYFASVREAIGRPGEQLDSAAATVAALRAELVARGGAYAESLAPGKTVRVAIDQVMSDESAVLAEGCEVAFFPPVTGG
jgi:sulfur-carrier protein